MRLGKHIKRDTQLIMISVIVLTIVTMSVSYSAFFTVQSLSTIQEISTGNLDVSVTVDNTNSILSDATELFPSTASEATDDVNGKYSSLTLVNNGSLDADFSVTLSYDFDKLRELSEYSGLTDAQLLDLDELVSFNYLNVGIYDVTNGEWIDFSEGSSENLYPTVSSLMPSATDSNAYPILRDSVTSGATRKFRVYIWLSDDTPTSEIGKLVYLKLNIKNAAGNETIAETVESIS